MKVKLLNALKKKISLIKNKLPNVDSAKIQHDDETIMLITNGMPSSISIQYTGTVYFESNMSPLIKVKFSKNTIYIFNFFRQELPEQILGYSGDLTITNCRIMSFNQTSCYPTIEGKIGEDKAEKSETNFEDDDMTLYGQRISAPKYKGYRGASKPQLASDRFDKHGGFQKFGKVEK